MKKIYKWLVPNFFKNLDKDLLTTYPVIWRTKAHFVFFYGAILTLLLFAFGFFYPIDAQHLTVDPSRPIELGYDTYHLYTVLFVSIFIVYWAYTQYTIGFPFTKLKDTLITLLIYAACFWFIFGIVTPSCRMGTIVKTAYFWMSDEDIEAFEKSGIYPYGCVLLEKDSIYIPNQSDSCFIEREAVFKEICKTEDTLLQNLYNTDPFFWKNWMYTHDSLSNNLDESFELYLSRQSYRSYRLSNQSYPSYMSNNIDEYHSYLSCLSDLSYLSYLSYQSNLPNLSYLSYLSNLSYLSDTLDMSKRSGSEVMRYQSNLSDLSNLSYLALKSFLLDYYKFKDSIIQSNKTRLPLKDYNFADNIRTHNILILSIPKLPYTIEDAIRSVKHAQLFIKEKQLWNYSIRWIYYIFILSFLLYTLPFLRLRNLVIFTILTITLLIFFYEKIDYYDIKYWILPLFCTFLLSFFFSIKKNYYSIGILLFNGLFMGLLNLILVIGISKNSDYDKLPSDFIFYGIQIVTLLSIILFNYIRSLPKAK